MVEPINRLLARRLLTIVAGQGRKNRDGRFAGLCVVRRFKLLCNYKRNYHKYGQRDGFCILVLMGRVTRNAGLKGLWSYVEATFWLYRNIEQLS